MIADAVAALGLAAGILAGALGAGRLVARGLGLPTAPGLTGFVTAGGLGLGALSHLWLLLGAVDRYRPAAAWLVWLAGLALLAATVRAPRMRAGDALRAWRALAPAERALGAVLAALGGLAVGGALAPPFSIDVLRHHLPVARLFVRAGGLAFEPIVLYLQPLGGEMFYVWSLLLGGPIAGKLVLAGAVLLAAGAVAALAARHGSRTAGLLAALIVLGTTWIWYFPTEGKVDALLLLHVALALLWLDAWRAGDGARALVAAGVFVGFAASSKLLGLYALVAATAVVAVTAPAGAARSRARAVALFLAAVAVTGWPWYARTWWLTGDPLWPMLAPWLGGMPGSAALYRDALGRLQARVSVGLTPSGFLHGLGAMVAGAPVLYGRGVIGPLLLAGLPLLALDRARARCVAWLGGFAAVYYMVWFPLDQQGRYLLPAVLALAVPAAVGLEAGRRLGGLAARAVTTGVLLWGVTSAGLAAWHLTTLAPVIVGREPVAAFLGRTTSYHAEIDWMHRHLPADAVVAANWDALYHLDRRTVWLEDFQGYVDAASVTSPEEFGRALARWGVTHLFLVDTARQAADDGDRASVFAHALAARCGRVIHANPDAVVVTSVTLARRRTGAAAVVALEPPCR